MSTALPQPPYYQAGHATAHDVAIWHTCQILELIDAGSVEAWPAVPTSFAPMHARDERVVAQGAFVLSDYGAVGDGAYAHDGGFFFATGGLGLALTAGIAAGRAAGNARRRRAAQDATRPRWKQIDRGRIWVSTYGFYLLSEAGQFYSWTFTAIDAAHLVAPGSLWMSGESTAGPVSWILTSDWAELVLAFWCLVKHPGHPQFDAGAWVPSGWRDRIDGMGVVPPARLTPTSRLRELLA